VESAAGEAAGTEVAGEHAEQHQAPADQAQHAESTEANGAAEASEPAESAEATHGATDVAPAPEAYEDAAAAPAGQEHAEAADVELQVELQVEPQAGIAEPALNHDPVSQADLALPAHDSGVLRDTEHAAEPNPTTAAHGDPEDRRDAAQDAGVLTDDEPESRSA
jgi:segregation and condensation protein B